MRADPNVVWAAATVSIAFFGLLAFVVWRVTSIREHKGLARVLVALGFVFAALPSIILALLQ
jgi:hypothetical protein